METDDDMAAKMEILSDDGEIVTFTLDGDTPFTALPKTIENEQASFVITEECVCFYASEEDEGFLIVRNDDRVLVVEVDWDNKIQAIKILEIEESDDPLLSQTRH